MLSERLKRLTAWLLSIAMVASMVTDVLPAFAAGGSESTPSTQAVVQTPEPLSDYSDPDTGRPNLYVNFLGDNRSYLAPGSAVAVNAPAAPGEVDQSAVTNPDIDQDTGWKGYTEDDTAASVAGNRTIFWVGVGVDRMNILDLFKQRDDGIYSLELGFYYNDRYIEPYQGSDYLTTIRDANIGSVKYAHDQWSLDYEIIRAETGLDIASDAVTRESYTGPTMAQIQNPTAPDEWKMTYVSLEKTGSSGDSRFAGQFDGVFHDAPAGGEDGDTATAADTGSDLPTQYLLMIPFVLKEYDVNHNQRVCLRLIRDASHFSVGGGSDGSDPYAAWERVTTRNPDRELKLMTNFRGDLNIFTGNVDSGDPDDPARRQLYKGILDVTNAGSIENKASLAVASDPAEAPAGKVTYNMSFDNSGMAIVEGNFVTKTLEGLTNGLGMEASVTCGSGFTATVDIYYTVGSGASAVQVPIPHTETRDGLVTHYFFVVPEIASREFTVKVVFGIDDASEYWLVLREDHTAETPATPGGEITGNGTLLRATDPDDPTKITEIDKDTPLIPTGGYPMSPSAKVAVNSQIEIITTVHSDYVAKVHIHYAGDATGVNRSPNSFTADVGITVESDNTVIVPAGGTLIIDRMPESDVIVTVEYEPAAKYTALLEVWHDNRADQRDDNVAQLQSTVYTDANEPMEAYSAVVHHAIPDPGDPTLDNHSAVEGTFRELARVDASSARLSQSLGGDGRATLDWKPADDTDLNGAGSIMAIAYEVANGASPNSNDFSGRLAAGDLRALNVKDGGMRCDPTGNYYTDTTIKTQFFVRFLELCTSIKNSPTLTAQYLKQVRDPEDDTGTKILYSYYDLTEAQVQMYVLDYADYEEKAANGDPTASRPTLRTAGNAAAELTLLTPWYDPDDASHEPPTRPAKPIPTDGTGAQLVVREGRKVSVILEANSAYAVRSVDIYQADDTNYDTVMFSATRESDYQNVYTFDMPYYDCKVRVNYVRRNTNQLDLFITGDDGVADNETTVTAYAAGSGTAADQVSINTDGSKIENVLEDSTVTVRVKRDVGYKASVTVTRISTGEDVTVQPTLTDPLTALSTVFTFAMPNDEVEIHVTYTRDDTPHEAIILPYFDRGDGSDPINVLPGGNAAEWDGHPNVQILTDQHSGTALRADATVGPGYYIYSVRAYTENGNEDFVLSSNGWNNGAGGSATVDVTMPDDTLYVEIIYRQGPPEIEPNLPLTLRVADPDNVGTTPDGGGATTYDENWASATIATPAAAPGTPINFGPLGKSAAYGNGTLDQTEYTTAGDLVELEFHRADGYYVKSITVSPSHLTVPVVWTSDHTARFNMPAGSTSVTVTFAKSPDGKDPNKYYLTFDKTENGVAQTVNTAAQGNRLDTFKSPTIPVAAYTIPETLPATLPTEIEGAGTTTGAAKPGETVTVNLKVKSGWYIHGVTVVGNSGVIPCTVDDHGDGTAEAKFIMPTGNTRVTVHYRQGEKPDEPVDYALQLVVSDPQNLPPNYVNNWASADVTGSLPASIGPLGLAQPGGVLRQSEYVKAGDTVTIEYGAAAGFVMDIALVTHDGGRIIPTYLPGDKAQFTMPNKDVTAEVRFRLGPATEYTANLVLRMPDGTPIADYDTVGLGTFVTGTSQLWGNRIYSRTANLGDRIDVALLAQDGYYISKIEITPATLGVSATLTGSLRRQDGWFTMPGADVTVNVYFEKGWPDEIPYDVTLRVLNGDGGSSAANFASVGTATLTADEMAAIPAASDDKSAGSWSKTIVGKAHDRDEVRVELHPETGYYVESVTVTDSAGATLPWWYVAGGVAFDMSPAHATITVRFAKGEIPPERFHDVTLHVVGVNDPAADASDTDADTATLTADIPAGSQSRTLRTIGSETITSVPAGATLSLEAINGQGSLVAYAYAVDGSGRQIMTPMTLVTDGGTQAFGMPNSDAHVYISFVDGTSKKDDDLIGELIVSGPGAPGTSGSAVMYATATPTVTTGNVDASGAGSLWAARDTELKVDLTVNPGYNIAGIRVIDHLDGTNVPYTWTDGTQRSFTTTMGAQGVRVYVEYEEIDPNANDLTAQIVVNDGRTGSTPTGNTAVLKRASADTTGAQILTGLSSGDPVYVDITVQPGYRVEYIKVVPAKYGIAPSLTDRDTVSQQTSFHMPGEDVVVYVKFAQDLRERHRATLVMAADGTNPDDVPENWGTIKSNYTGTKGPMWPNNPYYTDTVLAAAADDDGVAEWVTVDYGWGEDYSVKSITVVDAAGNMVAFTQYLNDNENRLGQLAFPMVNNDVTVTITYQKTPVPTKYRAVLHVVDLDATATPATNPHETSWGKLTWEDDTTGEIPAKLAGDPAGEAVLLVPGGETVTVDALADVANDPGVRIQAAYVIYRKGGQMIYFNFDEDSAGSFGDTPQDTFVMHPGSDVDVYIYYTSEPAPPETEYAAVLMLDSPNAPPPGDIVSTATLQSAARAADGLDPKMVTANTPPDHVYITAAKDDTITIEVDPAIGYIIESILFTPLGIEESQGLSEADSKALGGVVKYTRVNNTITFPMPGKNVAVRVKLVASTEKMYTATIHYGWAGTGLDERANWADLKYQKGSGDYRLLVNKTDPNETDEIPEKTIVTLDVSMDDPDLVMAAYVLRENGTLVPLSKALEGSTETLSQSDGDIVDDFATFEMPDANVDVFVWFTDVAPTDKWHTAVLVVTDENRADPPVINSGKNSATIKSSDNNPDETTVYSYGVWDPVGNAPAHAFMWVTEGETITVTTQQPAPGYAYQSANVTTSPGLSPALTMTESGVLPKYNFTFTVGEFNSAVRVHYASSDTTKNSLDVIIKDPDNPGDGSVINSVHVTPKDMTALDLRSTTSAGARQTIPDVMEGTAIAFTVKAKEGYVPVAVWSYGDVKQRVELTVDTTAGGYTTYTGAALSMPDQAATLTITYRTDGTRPGDPDHLYDLTMVWVGAQGADQATMNDGTYDPALHDNGDIIPDLGGGEQIDYTALADAGRRVAGIVLSYGGNSETLPIPAADASESFTMPFSDATLTVVFEAEPTPGDDPSHIAAVKAKNLPDGCAAPTIRVTPTANPVSGTGWTAAKTGNRISVHVTVPYGYEARITGPASVTDLSATTVSGPLPSGGTDPSTLPPTQRDVTFTMPNEDVTITVTYVKTRFTAKLRVLGAEGNDHAILDPGAEGDSVTATATDTEKILTGLTGNAELTYNIHPDTDREVIGIILTWANGTNMATYHRDTKARTANFNMDNGDVTVTVIFGDNGTTVRRHIASVVTVGDDGVSENAAQQIIDMEPTTGYVSGGLWTYGDDTDQMKVFYTIAPGYSAKVTATTVGVDGAVGESISILQQGSTAGAGTAEFIMPDADVVVTITYFDEPVLPPGEATEHELRLRIVGHGGEAENKAVLTVTDDGRILVVNGATDPTGAPVYSNGIQVRQGSELYVSADRRSDYKIVGVTITIGATIAPDGTLLGGVETELDWNEYLLNSTSLMEMPAADAIVTVYYQRAYIATLEIFGQEAGDSVTMEDDRPTGSQSVSDLDAPADRVITGLQGGEHIITTPESTDPGRKISVVRTGKKSGSRVVPLDTATIDPNDHTFTMPEEDMVVSVLFQEEEPEDPKDKKYLLTVEYQGDLAEGNAVAAENTTHGDLAPGTGLESWTWAMDEDEIVLTVSLAEGYQARIISVKRDSDGNDVYISKVSFTEKTADKTARLTMPADDVVVIIQFYKGYSVTLDVTDASGVANNAAQVKVPSNERVTGVSDAAGNITYNYYDPTGAATVGEQTIDGLAGGNGAPGSGARVSYEATPQTGVKTKIVKTTLGGGSLPMTANPGTFYMDRENVTVGVLFQDENATDDQLAKVALAGESDIVGNGMNQAGDPIPTIVDTTTPAPVTTTGTIWTTTENTHIIQVTLTVAKGYMATVEAVCDSDGDADHPAGTKLPMDNGDGVARTRLTFTYADNGTNIGDPQTLTFEMPDITDVTVTITYTKVGLVPRPYDPELVDDPLERYEDGWIRLENRGDYAVVTIPTLADESTGDAVLESVDKLKHTFRFHILEDVTGDRTSWEPQSLDDIIKFSYPDPDYDGTETYLYGENYYTDDMGTTDTSDDVEYIGVKFFLTVLTDEEIEDAVKADGAFATDADKDAEIARRIALAEKLRAILDNGGTDAALADTDHPTRLFVTTLDSSMNPTGESDLTDVEIPRYYELRGFIESYAPTHPAYLSLYTLKADDPDATPPFTADADKAEDYEEKAWVMTKVFREEGENLWVQKFSLKSSNLLGKLDVSSLPPADGEVYFFEIAKASHVRYEALNVTLSAGKLDDPADADCRSITVENVLQLIAGDLDSDGVVRMNDLTLLTNYLGGRVKWNQGTDEKAASYAYSVYNPRSLAYWADLTGDGMITISDRAVMMNERNYTKSYANNTPLLFHCDAPATTAEDGSVSLFDALDGEGEDHPVDWIPEEPAETPEPEETAPPVETEAPVETGEPDVVETDAPSAETEEPVEGTETPSAETDEPDTAETDAPDEETDAPDVMETEAPPAESEEPPAETDAPPTQSEEPPAQETEKPPVETKKPPVVSPPPTVRPTDPKPTPAQTEAPPIETETPPAQTEALPESPSIEPVIPPFTQEPTQPEAPVTAQVPTMVEYVRPDESRAEEPEADETVEVQAVAVPEEPVKTSETPDRTLPPPLAPRSVDATDADPGRKKDDDQ